MSTLKPAEVFPPGEFIQDAMDRTTRLCFEAWPEDRRSKQLSKSYIAQLAEEVGELAKACRKFWGRTLRPEECGQGNKEPIIDEVGDVLFVVLRICWLYEVDPAQAIKGAMDKFETRLKLLEEPGDARETPAK